MLDSCGDGARLDDLCQIVPPVEVALGQAEVMLDAPIQFAVAALGLLMAHHAGGVGGEPFAGQGAVERREGGGACQPNSAQKRGTSARYSA